MLELQGSFIILSYIRTVLNIKSNKGKISYKGTSIRLSTDFLTETLQARREWHDIFKVMKREEPTIKNTLPSYVKFKNKIKLKQTNNKKKNTLPSKPHSDLMEKSKAFQISKFERIQHHQTSFTTNAKGTSLSRKQDKEKTYKK